MPKKYPNVIAVALNPALDQSIVVSDLKIGGLNRSIESRLDVGGKAANVSKALFNFKIPVHIIGFLAGSEGYWLEENLKKLGISGKFTFIEGNTRTNFKIVNNSTKVTTEINQSGFAVTEKQVDDIIADLFHIAKSGDIIVLSGSLPPGAPKDTYSRIVMQANELGIMTVLDCDRQSCSEAIKKCPTIVKQNTFELQALIGRTLLGEKDLIVASSSFLNAGTQLLIVSYGPGGALFVWSDDVCSSVPEAVTVKSTVGAGDAMVAATLYGMLNGMSHADIAKYATAAGTMTVTKPGSTVCTFEEMKDFLPHVTVKTIAKN